MQEAVLVLADGSVFKGISLGATGLACGELVFNTSMAGYQEIITDPSYNGQIITFTYPSTVNSNVTIATDIDPTLSLFGQREEIRQVLLNIILNALDVLTETEDPCITITSFQTNKCKKIIIANNGPEIKAEILSEIFKPFITNKQSGTGLGLFVCKEIIEKHNGWLNCSTSKKETRFTITFPITK